jgi:hypothetical protein
MYTKRGKGKLLDKLPLHHGKKGSTKIYWKQKKQ